MAGKRWTRIIGTQATVLVTRLIPVLGISMSQVHSTIERIGSVSLIELDQVMSHQNNDPWRD